MQPFRIGRWISAASLLAFVIAAGLTIMHGTASWYVWLLEMLALFLVAWLLFVGSRFVVRLLDTVFASPIEAFLDWRKGRDVHGSARWARGSEIATGPLSHGGSIVLGLYKNWRGEPVPLTTSGIDHTLIIGSTRSGKTASNILPSLLSWHHSALILDVKSELFEHSSGMRQRELGNKVFRFAPGEPDNPCRINFLQSVRVGTIFESADCLNIATALVEEGVPVSGADAHWQSTAQALLGAVIAFVLHGNRGAALADVGRAMSDPAQSTADLFSAMMKDASPMVSSEGRAMKDRSDRESASIVSTCLRHLQIFRSDPIVARNTSGQSDISLEADLMDGECPVSLYIQTRASDLLRLRPVVRLVLELAMSRLLSADLKFSATGEALQPHRWRLLLALDELPTLGRMPTVEDSLSRAAGFGISALLAVQDLGQLRRAYGEREMITANMARFVCMPPSQLDTAVWISKMIGSETRTTSMQSQSTSRDLFGPRGSRSETDSLQITGRPLLFPEEVIRLPKLVPNGPQSIPGSVLILSPGSRPIHGTQALYFQNEELKRRAMLATATQEAVVVPLRPVADPFPRPRLIEVPAAARRAALIAAAVSVPALTTAATFYAASSPTTTAAVSDVTSSINAAAGLAGIATPPLISAAEHAQAQDAISRAQAKLRYERVREYCQKMAQNGEATGVFLYPNQCRQQFPEFLKSAR